VDLNGGIADVYVVFARTGEAAGARASRLHRRCGTPGFEIAERIQVIAPHRWPACVSRIAAFRHRSAWVGARASRSRCERSTSFARRWPRLRSACALRARLALHRATTRKMFNQTLADFQLTQAKLAQMATTIDSSALLTYRAAWQRDQGRRHARGRDGQDDGDRGRQQVIDAAVQMWGGLGVVSEQPSSASTARSRVAHLRGRDRGPAADHRARAVEDVR